MIGLELTVDEKPHFAFPDTAVEISVDASLETLQNLMRRVEDGHIMLQTWRECPLAENCLERDFTIK